jgi:G3E family GTPase
MDIPVTVVGGYLGAGKTTLINSLLRHANGVKLAVLVNEFGELSIDADLIEAEDDGMISISGGCVCCAFGSDLIGALEDVQRMKPDHVLIEASGVALPASIATTVGLVDGLRADAVVVLADAEQVQANAASPYLADTIDRQLAQADIVLLTKPDLVTDAQRERVVEWLRGKARGARVIPAEQGNVPLSAVVGALPLPARGKGAAPETHGAFASIVLEPVGPVDAQALALALGADEGITRAKGFVPVEGGMALIHVVGHRATVEAAKGEHPVGVVCIGVREVFDAGRLKGLV